MSDPRKYKVLFVTPTLGCGGAEKLLIQLLESMNRSTLVPMLAVLNAQGELVSEVPDDVRVFDLRKRSRYDFLTLQWRINSIVRRFGADVVVALISYTNYLVLMSRALFRWNKPVIACLHTTLTPSLPSQSFARVKKILVREFYPKAEAVVTVSESAKRDLVEVTGLPEDKVHVIYNPVDAGAILAMAREPLDHETRGPIEIVAVGRLTAAKDYPNLLKAFRIVRSTSEVHLTIIGEGEERPLLERLLRELGLEACVTLQGFDPNPYKYMASAKLLVLSSAWEGFPTVIEEAMACGTPVVATDCASGPSEIITDGENGLLVPVGDEVTLAGAIKRVLDDEDLRGRLAAAGKRRIEDFTVEKTVREYESLVLEVAAGD